MIGYKGFTAKLEYDPQIKMFRGTVINTRSHIDFLSDAAAGLEDEFHRSVEAYLAVCAERGIEPEKPYSGKLNLRLGEELHAKAALAATASGKSLNGWLVDAIRREAEAAEVE